MLWWEMQERWLKLEVAEAESAGVQAEQRGVSWKMHVIWSRFGERRRVDAG